MGAGQSRLRVLERQVERPSEPVRAPLSPASLALQQLPLASGSCQTFRLSTRPTIAKPGEVCNGVRAVIADKAGSRPWSRLTYARATWLERAGIGRLDASLRRRLAHRAWWRIKSGDDRRRVPFGGRVFDIVQNSPAGRRFRLAKRAGRRPAPAVGPHE